MKEPFIWAYFPDGKLKLYPSEELARWCANLLPSTIVFFAEFEAEKGWVANEYDYIKQWTLTPDNIPEFCAKSGADKDRVMADYNRAKSQGKPLYGYINKENFP